MARRRKNPLVHAATLLPLAIGLASNLSTAPSAPGPERVSATAVTTGGGCVANLSLCPTTGCAQAKDPDEQILNETKRHRPSGSNAKALTWEDFSALQQDADSTVGEAKALGATDRDRLRNFAVSGGRVSEGDLVQLDGYLVGTPHPNTGESVNCNLKGSANNDFHIPFADDPDKTPFQGIVVEMIPQNRPTNWTIVTLNRVKRGRRMVRVIGQLFYDNAHRVNADEDAPIGGQPARFSLFEIHPITSVSVCKQSESVCTDWETLDEFAQEKTPG
ncbi:MAG: hypothetical protein LAO06_03895 [Acidobacteriia bacterium]|nr:hypothetical protein [Terriglobia bacterium]